MKRVLGFLSIFLLCSFNTLFKYMSVHKSMNSLNSNSSVVGGFITSSSVKVSYLNIFLYTLLLTCLLFTILYFLLRDVDISFKYIIGIIISIIVLFFNSFIAFLILIISCLFFVINLFKKIDIKKLLFIILLFVIYFLIFYYISF